METVRPHDQEEMQAVHWRDQIEEWKQEHATLLSSLVELDRQVLEHSARVAAHMDRIVRDEVSHLTHDMLEQTPEGRAFAERLGHVREEHAAIEEDRAALHQRLLDRHEGVMRELEQLVKFFQA